MPGAQATSTAAAAWAAVEKGSDRVRIDLTAAPCCAPLAKQPLTEGEAAELAPMFKAIADPVRLRLLSLVASHADGEACVCDLTTAFDLKPPTISHHLKVLREAGLLSSDRRGTWVYYRLNPVMLARLSAILGTRDGAGTI